MPFSGFQDFNPAFAGSLQQMFAAHPGLFVNSGYRTPEHQAELFRRAVAKYGSEAAARHWVAPPGHSMHNKGMAADLGFANAAAEQWAHQHAADYNLRFRMGHEPWHIEPIGGGGGGGGAPPSSSASTLMSPTPMAQTAGMTGQFQPALGDVVAPQGVQSTLMPPNDMGSLAYNFLQQAEERRQREEQQQQQQEATQRAALFTPPPSGLAALYS
jgi:hypothetical protein